MNHQCAGALQAPVDGRARRAGDTQQPTPRGDFLDQVDDACRPGLLAQSVDGLPNALFLLDRKARRQRLPSSRATRDGSGFVHLTESRTVAIDGDQVNAEACGQAFGPGLGHWGVAQGTQRLRNPLKPRPALARDALKGTGRAAAD